MKIGKKQEKELLQVYDKWLHSYLNGDVKTYDFYLDDAFRFVGSTGNEEFLNKKDTTKFFAKTADQFAGKTDLKNTVRTVEFIDGIAFVTELFDAYFLIESDWKYYGRFRFTSALRKKKAGWRFIYQHFSMPDTKAQEGETLGAEQISKENQELRDAIKRRTFELEHKNRELEIEASLEKVRARTMAMQHSEELPEAAILLFNEIQALAIPAFSTGYCIWEGDKTSASCYMGTEGLLQKSFILPTMGEGYNFYDPLQRGETFYVAELGGDELVKHYEFMRTIPVFGEILDGIINEGVSLPSFQIFHIAYFSKGYLMFITYEPVPDAYDVFKRFAKVFEQTYTRFLDLQKAEAQAREAQVEIGLERVRAEMMAMHKSDELRQVVGSVFNQLQNLGFDAPACSMIIYNKDLSAEHWFAGMGQDTYPKSYKIPYVDNPYFTDLVKAWKKGTSFEEFSMEGKLKISYAGWLLQHSEFKYLPKEFQNEMLTPDLMLLSDAFNRYGMLEIIGPEPLSKDKVIILQRFSKVFEQTYTRFLDLQKAEEQAKEAQIEVALEKVRSRSLAMHQTSELQEVINVVHHEFKKLKVAITGGVFIAINDEIKEEINCWGSGGTTDYIKRVHLPFLNSAIYTGLIKNIQKGTGFFTEEFSNQQKKKLLNHLFKQPAYAKTSDKNKKEILQRKGGYTRSCTVSKNTSIFIINHHGVKFSKEDNEILKRFGNVFEQTYTRFLDLQKAEAQVREAQIEAALEKVRSRSLAMHKSDELSEVIIEVRSKFQELDISMESRVAVVVVFDKNSRDFNQWVASPDFANIYISTPYFENPILEDFWTAKEGGVDFYSNSYSLEVKNSYFKYFFEHSLYKNFEGLEERKKWVFEQEFYTYSPAIEKNSSIGIADFSGKELTESEIEIIKRFAKVFEQAYIRFLDLQKAEAQAREAQIETALERVRSRSLAMQQSEELQEVIQVVYDQFIHLNIPIEHTGFIMDYKARDDMYIWLADEHGVPSQVTIPYIDAPHWNSFNEAKEKGLNFFANKLNFKETNSFYQKLLKYIPDLPEEAKEFYLNCPSLDISTVLLDDVALYIENFSGIPYTKEENNILMRFGKVFQQTYTRFLDLLKAEEQAREAQIEAALERVRAKSMAMHKTSELKKVIDVISEQFAILGIAQDACMINIFGNETSKDWNFWIATYPDLIHVPFFKNPILSRLASARKKNEVFYSLDINQEEKNKFFEHFYKLAEGVKVVRKRRNFIFKAQGWTSSVALSKFASIHLINYNSKIYTEEENQVLQRIGMVFEQTYTRFLDLQKAENQAREAQIEAALERVRSKTMAMHNSQDVNDAVITLFEEILKQNDDTSIRCGIGILSKSEEMELWTASFDKNNKVGIDYGSLNMNLHPLLIGVKKTWKAKKERFFYKLKGKELVNYFDALNNAKEYTFKTDLASLSNEVYHNSFIFSEGVLFAFTSKPIPEYTMQVFKRFAAVFEQTYTRFLDLQKAEAQVREAQIEAALERVRARTMGMHRASELQETSSVLFKQLEELGIKPWRCGVALLNENEKTLELWSATSSKEGNVVAVIGDAPVKGHWATKGLQQAIKKQDPIYIFDLSGKKLKEYLKYISQDFKIAETKELAPAIPERLVYYCPIFSKGTLYSAFQAPISDAEIQILQRFTKVFEQTYIRFLDLQKAETQAREAQIETSLERVRSKAMAMHNSKDLVITANQLFQEFQYLEISFIRCGVLKIKEDKTAEVFSYSHTKENNPVAVFGNMKLTDHEFMDGVFKHWKLQKEYVHEMKGDAVKRYYKLINKQVSIPKLQLEKSHFGYVFFFPEGCLYCFTNEKLSEDTLRILRKFNTVMALTYRRYFELQEAEARELAAIKESSLDRVRAEIASMQTADDLNRITPLVWKELNTLGVPFFRCGVFIIDNKMQKVHAYLSTPSGESLAALELEFDSLPLVKGVLSHWKKQKVYIEKWNKEQFIEFTQPLIEQGQINSSKKYQGGLEAPEQLVLQMVPFKQGMLYVGSENSLTNDQIATVESLAKAFSVAYTRYEDFKELEAAKSKAEETLSELKTTQTQLIQSEKMASLGELTAGIAHEIQNPLNFVNNFSELSEEMLEELEEGIKDNSDEIVTEIMTDLKQNLNKITNHGKRASNIVKGMLDHSRTGSGISELTDINKLADEYLRLSYHGLRAKDKSFNADFKTDFDTTLPKIKVITQDLGRVILNLINNAFYACTERSRSTSNKDYKPKVTVSTKACKSTSGDLGVEIRVKDNGSGIPDNIKDKIFQPFFTTKPTGSGTGLGLSLAYDIITKGHGGDLKVDSKEGEFTRFIIVLPVKK